MELTNNELELVGQLSSEIFDYPEYAVYDISVDRDYIIFEMKNDKKLVLHRSVLQNTYDGNVLVSACKQAIAYNIPVEIEYGCR